MEIRCFTELSEAQLHDWRAFLSASPYAHPRQDPRFAAIEHALGRRVVFAIGRKGGDIRAVGLFSLVPGPLPGRFASALALSGPVADDTATLVSFLQEVVRQPEFRRVDALRVTPYRLDHEAEETTAALRAAGFGCSDPEPARHTGIVDLSPDEEGLRASFSRSARRKLKAVEASDVEIREITDPREIEVFFERLNTLVLHHYGLTPVAAAEVRAGTEHIYTDPGIGVMFGAFHEGSFLGGLLLYRSHHTAHARRGVADTEVAATASNLRVVSSLWLRAMLWARDQGCRYLDVEGYRVIEDKTHPQFNIYEYKRQFGPRPATRLAEHTLPLSAFHLANTLPRRVAARLKRRLPRLAQRVKDLRS